MKIQPILPKIALKVLQLAKCVCLKSHLLTNDFFVSDNYTYHTITYN